MKNLFYFDNSVIYTFMWIALIMTALVGCDPDDIWPDPPTNPCESNPCPDLEVRVLEVTQEGIRVSVANIGDKATEATIKVSATFSLGGVSAPPYGQSIPALRAGETKELSFKASIPFADSISVELSYHGSDRISGNNHDLCTWWPGWDCNSWHWTSTAAQADAGESPAFENGADPVELIESRKELFVQTSSNFFTESPGSFAGAYRGVIKGVENTYAPFLIEFVEGDSDLVGLVLLPGLKISMCDASGPVYSFFDAAEVTITGTSFTTKALETNNEAKVTLSGNLSEDGTILDLALKIDPDNADCGKTLTATAQRLIVPINLTLQLQEAPGEVIAGQNLAYRLNITNNGRVSSLSPVLYATVPASLNLITPAGVSCAPQSDTQVCPIPIAQLNPDTSTVLDLVFDTTHVATKSFVSRFEVIADGDPSLDVAPEDNVAEATHQVTFVSDLSITKSASPDPVAAGSVLRYIITVKNNGPSLAEAVSVQDTLPEGVSLVSSSATANCVLSDMTLTCTLGALTAGASAEIIVEVLVDADLVYKAGSPTTITNQASVTGAADAIDPDLSNNATSLDTLVIAMADLEISSFDIISNPPEEMIIGEDIEFTLSKELINRGPSNPMRTRLINNVTTTGGVTSKAKNPDLQNMSPDPSEEPEILGEVLDTYTIRCVAPGEQRFTFTSEIQPLKPEDTDPDLSNNSKTLHIDVECVLPVAIDIRNKIINLKSNRPVTVLVLTNSAGEFELPVAFDASTIDPLSVRFGLYDTVWNETGGASDTDGNGQRTRRGMRLYFRALEAGLTEEATMACVKGTWIDTDGIPRTFFGCDTVVVKD